MTVLTGWTAVILIVLFGMTLNYKLLDILNRERMTEDYDGIDRLLSSILPGLAIVGGLGTILGSLHLFCIEFVLPLVVLLTWSYRKSVFDVLGDMEKLASRGWQNFQSGNPIPLLVVFILLVELYILTIGSLIPSGNADVWVFQVPLAQSVIEHKGFVSPQIGHPFYGNIPLFFNVLFASAMLFSNHWFSANVVNIAIFLGFVFLLTSCNSRWRGAGFLLVFWLIVYQEFFSSGVGQPLTDISRSCFTVASVLFVWRYLERGRPAELLQCALVLGGAVGSKYTELLMLGLVGIILIPLIFRGKISMKLLFFSFVSFMIIAGYWYLKNLIVLGNPIYPFIFGHPGLTDAWMSDYMLELGRAFEPEHRRFVTNLGTLQGWYDFFWILYHWFLKNNAYSIMALLMIVCGAVSSGRRLIIPVALTAVMFMVWYAMMFNHIRWAMPAYLLFLSCGFIGASLVREYFEDWIIHSLMPGYAVWSNRIFVLRHLSPILLMSAFALILVGAGFILVLREQGRWQVQSGSRLDLYIGKISLDRYLAKNLEGYTIYVYIGSHNLKMVLQPFDTSGSMYSAALNGGVDGKWLIPRERLPKTEADIERFINDEKVNYFIEVPIQRPEFLAERLGAENLAMAMKVIDYMRPYSSLIVTDEFGWKLYRYERNTL